jgi:hypothetical protein
MRTTVTINSDVARLLKERMLENHCSFKEVLNDAVRRGIQQKDSKAAKQKPFVVKAKNLGLHPGIDYNRLNQLPDELETEASGV